MDIEAYAVHFGNGLRSLHRDRARAEEWAARCSGTVRPLYELTDEERQWLLDRQSEATTQQEGSP